MINEVYRVVQVILNKNDKGVITPDRFNDLANMAQAKIFSELPDDIRRSINKKNAGYNSMPAGMLRDALGVLTKDADIIRGVAAPYYFMLPEDLSAIESIFSGQRQAERIDYSDIRMYENSVHSHPTLNFPMYAVSGKNIQVLPKEIQNVSVTYRRSPKSPKWTYIETGGKAIFNITDASYTDFELPFHFFSRIVIDMMTYLGLHLKEQDVIQISQQEQAVDLKRESSV